MTQHRLINSDFINWLDQCPVQYFRQPDHKEGIVYLFCANEAEADPFLSQPTPD